MELQADKEEMGKDLLSMKAEVSDIKVMVHGIKGNLSGKHSQIEETLHAKVDRLLRVDQERSDAINKLESKFKKYGQEIRTGDSGFGSGSFGMVDTDSRSGYSRKGGWLIKTYSIIPSAWNKLNIFL